MTEIRWDRMTGPELKALAGRDALVDWTAAWRATRDSLDAVLKEASA